MHGRKENHTLKIDRCFGSKFERAIQLDLTWPDLTPKPGMTLTQEREREVVMLTFFADSDRVTRVSRLLVYLDVRFTSQPS